MGTAVIVKDQEILDVYHKWKRLEKLINVTAEEEWEPTHHRILRDIWRAVSPRRTVGTKIKKG